MYKRQGLVTIQASDERDPEQVVQDAVHPDRKSYLVSLGRSAAWRAATAAALRETPPLYGVSVTVGQPDAMPDVDLLVPEDGAPWEQLSTLRDNIVITLAELRR